MIGKLFDSLKRDGPIRFLINLFCLLILYAFLYIIYFWARLAYMALYSQPRQMVTIPFYMILHAILSNLFLVCIILIGMLGELFVILYIVWKTLRTILGIFAGIIDNLPLFKECRETGLFPFLDRLSEILFGRDAFMKRLQNAFDATFQFLRTFMESTFGIVFEGYELDKEYLNAALDLFLTNRLYEADIQRCENKKKEVIRKLRNKVPLIKVNFNKDVPTKELSSIEKIKLNNCIKDNTVDIPQDINTIEKLTLIAANEVAKKKCELGITSSNKCIVSDFEKTVKEIADNVSSGSIQNFDKVKDVILQKQVEYTTEVPRQDLDNAMK